MDSFTPAPDLATDDSATACHKAQVSTLPLPAHRRRVVVVSNRVVKPGHEHVGGLGQALKSALSDADGLWMGWSGDIGNDTDARRSRVGNMEFVVSDFCHDEYQCYYRGFSNSVLWPLLHARPDLMDFDSRDLQGYLSVNRRFARQLQTQVREGDIVWVHDYHLLPLAQQARELGVRAPIGLFLHTPVPAPAILCVLPHHQQLLGMLAAFDLIGVQTDSDAMNLRDYFERELGAQVSADGRLRLGDGRSLRIQAFPIGIDADAVARIAAEAGDEACRRFACDDATQLIGVDRLDYSKGIPERLRCIDQLLRSQPELGRRLRYLQVAPTSRGDVEAYQVLARRVESLVDAINARHASTAGGQQPVTCLRKALPLRTLAGLYRRSRVALVTPLRDGMNLVAKEYVAAQDPLDPGVLVLSSFAGAACELDAALLVNPYDTQGMADTVARALAMPRGERRERWQAMMEVIRDNDIHAWSRGFLRQLRTLSGTGLARIAHESSSPGRNVPVPLSIQ